MRGNWDDEFEHYENRLCGEGGCRQRPGMSKYGNVYTQVKIPNGYKPAKILPNGDVEAIQKMSENDVVDVLRSMLKVRFEANYVPNKEAQIRHLCKVGGAQIFNMQRTMVYTTPVNFVVCPYCRKLIFHYTKAK